MKNRKMLYKFLSGLLSFTMLLEMAACSSKEGDSALQASNTAANLDPAILNFATQFEANKENFSRKLICDNEYDDINASNQDDWWAKDEDWFNDNDWYCLRLNEYRKNLEEYRENLDEISNRLADNSQRGENNANIEESEQILEDITNLEYPTLELYNISENSESNKKIETRGSTINSVAELQELLKEENEKIDKEPYDISKFTKYIGENELLVGKYDRSNEIYDVSHTVVHMSDLIDFTKNINANSRDTSSKESSLSSKTSNSDKDKNKEGNGNFLGDLIQNFDMTGMSSIINAGANMLGKIIDNVTLFKCKKMELAAEQKRLTLQAQHEEKMAQLTQKYEIEKNKAEAENKIAVINAEAKAKSEQMKLQSDLDTACIRVQTDSRLQYLDGCTKAITAILDRPDSERLKEVAIQALTRMSGMNNSNNNNTVLTSSARSNSRMEEFDIEDEADRKSHVKYLDVTVNFNNGERDNVYLGGSKIATGDTSWALVSIMKDDDGNIIDCVVTPINTPEKLDIA